MLQYLVLCVLFLTFPAVCLIREIRFLCRTRNCHMQVDGKIVRMEEKIPIMRRGRSEFVVEAAYTYDGISYSAPAFRRFRYSDYCVDQFVNVYVDPDNPACFVLGSERDATKTSILVGFLVLFVLMIALAVLNAEITDSNKRQDAINAAVSEMEEKLLAGDEDAFDDFVNDQVIRVVNGKEIN